MKPEKLMIQDKSLSHYGGRYSKLIDPMMEESRDRIVRQIPEQATVLDIGCGTGALCFDLRRKKQCTVVGADRSVQMLTFAREHNPYAEVHFIHQDATHLNDIADGSFDYAVAAYVIHELDAIAQQALVREAWRVAQSVILVDANAPLPWNLIGVIKRAPELGFGYEHYPRFRDYQAAGGIMGILRVAGLDQTVTHRELFAQTCNQIVVLAH